MNKAELIEKIAEESGLTKADANHAVDGFVESVTSALKSRDQVSLIGFSAFKTSKRAALLVRAQPSNRNTPATVLPTFKAGKGLKDIVKK